MNHKYFRQLCWSLLCLSMPVVQIGSAAVSLAELDTNRITAIASMLPEQPAGFGRPCTDRAFWDAPATRASVSNTVEFAETLLGKKFPAWNDDLYLEFSRNGRRPPGEKMLLARSAWLYPLVVAECLENRGRFVPLLNKILREYADEPTWTLPAHDGNLKNFRRETYSVDLRGSAFAAELAETLYLLGDRIDPAVRQQVTAALEQRIFAPIRETLRSGNGNWWMGNKSDSVKNNWNAVCLAGVVGAARTILADKQDRAAFIAAGEHYSAYFINGFHADGYCEEGPGYWAYGFGDYILLREILADASGGRIDLFSNPKIRAIAAYGIRIQMLDHLVPPFADCRFGTKADGDLNSYCNQVFKFGVSGYEKSSLVGRGKLQFAFMTTTPCAASAGIFADEKLPGLRSYFDKAGVLVCRPSPGTSNRISVAIKAGGNGSHSHNDIGSFVIAVGDEILAGDPGGPHAYNNKVFGPERYTYKILNSFGHPVPVVAGQLQKDATRVHPQVLETHFTEAQDEIKIDLKPAYTVPELEKLERTMRYSRAGAGVVEIEDSVTFTKPNSFEVALPTLAKVQKIGLRTFELTMNGEKILAEIETPDGFALTSERVEELDAPAFTRLGFKLLKPVTKATVKITFQPPSVQASHN